MRNLMYFLAGVAVLIGLFVLMSPPAAPPAAQSSSGPAAPAAAPAPKPVPAPAAAASADAPPPTPTPTPAGPRLHQVALRVGGEGLIEGPGVIRIDQGDRLILSITSAVDDELHLHGYDRHLHLRAGKTAVLELEATLSGRFEYELHKAHREIGALEVMPR